MTRPSKRSDARVRAAILLSLAHGATRTAAAAAVGVTHYSLRRWIDADPAFALAVEKAQAQMVTSLVDVVYATAMSTTQAGQPTQSAWLAAMTLLERRHPEDWGRRDRIDISIDVRREAEEIAAETGRAVDDVIAEIEAYLHERTGAKE